MVTTVALDLDLAMGAPGSDIDDGFALALATSDPGTDSSALHDPLAVAAVTRPDLEGWVGESGERLSAGERARVGLARALLSPAPVLLLDEPTAHLDTTTAAHVLDLVVADPRAVLLVTHDEQRLGPGWQVVRL